MNRKLWLQTAAILTLAISGVSTYAQTPGSPVQLADVHRSGSPTAALSPAHAIVFDAVPLGSSPQQLTATFSIGTAAGVPVASLHYGHDFSLGQISCADQICSVTVSFSPTLPGTRPDALFLTSGSQRIASIPLSGTGQSPFALVQPLSLASRGINSLPAVVDENGTLYSLDASGTSVTSTDASGNSMVLPIANLSAVHGIAIDGAGVLYLLPATADKALITYDTVQGTQSSFALPAPANTIDSIATGASGELYAVSLSASLLYKVSPDGTITHTSLPFGTEAAPSTSALALSRGVVSAIGALQKPVTSAARSELETSATSPFNVLGVDAAGTLYANSAGALLQLAAPDFTTAIGTLPNALAIGRDGSLLVAAANGVTRLDRTQTELDFGSVAPSADATPQVALLYNGGNQPLTISDIRVAGDGFSITAAPQNGCVGGVVVAPGSSCQLAVALQAPKTGAASGTVTIASNSLNQPTSLLSFPVKANVAGSQAVLTPNALIFPNTTVNVASAPLTITLSNPGTAALNISGIALTGAASGSYSVTNTCISSTVTSLAAGASCTISVIFKPLTAASQSATLSIADDLNGVVGSSQTASLTGLGVAAPAPVITFSAVSVNGISSTGLSFGSTSYTSVTLVPAGTPNPPTGTITITNTGNAVLNISTITLILSGTSTVLPYTETNNCPATLAVGASCVVTVQFVPPLGVGATYSAALVLVDNAAGSPQSFGISGISTTDDFTMSASTANLAISHSGGSGQITITATPNPAPFATPIALSVFGIPAGATYTFSPLDITAVTSPGTSVLTITLPNYQNIVLSNLDKPAILRRTTLPAAACLLAGLCLGGLRRKRMPRLTRAMQVLLIGLLGLGAMSMSACSSGVPLSGGVAPGTYYLTVTGSSANGLSTTPGVTHQTNIALLVQ